MMLDDVTAGSHLPAEIGFADGVETSEEGVDESDGDERTALPVCAGGRLDFHELTFCGRAEYKTTRKKKAGA